MKAAAKDDNQLKYVSFSDKLKEISLNARLGRTDCINYSQSNHFNADLDDTVHMNIEKSFFREALLYWYSNVSNSDYVSYSNTLLQLSKDYACVVYNESKIAPILLEALSTSSQESPMQALIDLVVQFANDIQSDMLKHLPLFFSVLLHTIDSNSVVVIESLFTAIASIFRMFSTAFTKNMDLFLLWQKMIFWKYGCLKSAKMENVVRFCCESSTFMVRRLLKSCSDDSQIQILFKILLTKMKEPFSITTPSSIVETSSNAIIQLDDDRVAQSFGLLLSTLCKLSSKHLHSSHQSILNNCWILCLKNVQTKTYVNTFRVALEICFSNLALYTKTNDNAAEIVKIVCNWLLNTSQHDISSVIFYLSVVKEFAMGVKVKDGILLLQLNIGDIVAEHSHESDFMVYFDDLLGLIQIIVDKCPSFPSKRNEWFNSLVSKVFIFIPSSKLIQFFEFASTICSAEFMIQIVNNLINAGKVADTDFGRIFACAKIALLKFYKTHCSGCATAAPMLDYCYLQENTNHREYWIKIPTKILKSFNFMTDFSTQGSLTSGYFDTDYLFCLPYIFVHLPTSEAFEIVYQPLETHLKAFVDSLAANNLKICSQLAPYVPLWLLNLSLLRSSFANNKHQIDHNYEYDFIFKAFNHKNFERFLIINNRYALTSLFIVVSVCYKSQLLADTFEFDSIFQLIKYNVLFFYGSEQWMCLRICHLLTLQQKSTELNRCLESLCQIDTYDINFSNYRQHYANLSKLIIQYVNHGCHEILLYYLLSHFHTNMSLLWKPAVDLIVEMNKKWYHHEGRSLISNYIWPLARDSMIFNLKIDCKTIGWCKLYEDNINEVPESSSYNNENSNVNSLYTEMEMCRHSNNSSNMVYNDSSRDLQLNFLKHIWSVLDEIVVKKTPGSLCFIGFFVKCVYVLGFVSGANPYVPNTLTPCEISEKVQEVSLHSLLSLLSKESASNLNEFNTKSNLSLERLILHLIKCSSVNIQRYALHVIVKLNHYKCLKPNLDSMCYWINLKGDGSSYKDIFLSLFPATIHQQQQSLGAGKDERDFPITPFTFDIIRVAFPVIVNLLIGLFKRRGNNALFLKGLLREALIVFQQQPDTLSSSCIEHYLKCVLMTMFPKENDINIDENQALPPVKSIFVPSIILADYPMVSQKLITDQRNLLSNHLIPIHLINVFINSSTLLVEDFKLDTLCVELILGGCAFVIDQADFLLKHQLFEKDDCAFSMFKRSKLKNLRKNAFNLLYKLFSNYPKFCYDRYENAIKEIFVFPNVQPMLIGSFFEPTHLLQLVSIWCCHPQYIQYLALTLPLYSYSLITPHLQSDTDINNFTLLHAVLYIWRCEKISVKTRIALATIIQNTLNIGTLNNFFPCGSITLDYIATVVIKFFSGIINEGGKKKGKLFENIELNLLLNIVSRGAVNVSSNESFTLLNFYVNTASSKGFGRHSLNQTKQNLVEAQMLTAVVGLLPPKSLFTLQSRSSMVLKLDDLIYRIVGLFSCLKVTLNEIIMIESLVTKGYIPNLILNIVRDMSSIDALGDCESPNSDVRKNCMYLIQKVASHSGLGFEYACHIERSVCVLFIVIKVLKNLTDVISTPILKDITLSTLDILFKSIWRNLELGDILSDDLVIILNKLLTKYVSSGLMHADEKHRSACCGVIELWCRCEFAADIKPLFLLSSADVEVDFFQNLFHIQTHRRQRAIVLLTNKLLLNEGITLTESAVEKILLPLVLGFVYDANNHIAKNHAVLDESIVAMGAIARRLKWKK